MTHASDALHDFGYLPVPTAAGDDDGESTDVVVATLAPVPMQALADALFELLDDVAVECLLDRAPLHWYRVSSRVAARRQQLAERLQHLGLRYVASAKRSASMLPEPARWDEAVAARPHDWPARAPRRDIDRRADGTRWFFGPNGIDLDRRLCGTGAGTRLAVVDEDIAEADLLDLDRLVIVNDTVTPGASFHGPLMIGWAVGTRATRDDAGARFDGVAPDASPRLYCVPKAGSDVLSVPLAIVRAVDDGADVVLCTMFVEGTHSPMLDDALEIAARLGRRGRGAAVVMACGRQASSPRGSLHASWTLAYDDPAADPRVFCVGPSGRDGGWFFWRDDKGRLHPFANRSPALRWLAPGDDVQYPFHAKPRAFHAESSGATAIAAGVLLLVLANNPSLRASDLAAIVTATCSPTGAPPPLAALADPYDVAPLARDRDGHDPKHGYGRMNATRACLAAADPIAQALVAIGEDAAARTFAALRTTVLQSLYSTRAARWLARGMIADERARHGMCALARHGRLVAGHRQRFEAHGGAALVVAQTVRALEHAARSGDGAPGPVRSEIAALRRRTSRSAAVAAAADAIFALLGAIYAPDADLGATTAAVGAVLARA